MKFRTTLFLLLISLSLPLSAQIGEASRRSGDLYFENGRFRQALAAYLPILEKDPEDLDLRYRMGRCYYELNELQEALGYFDFVLRQEDDPDPLVYLYRGRVLHNQMEFLDAIEAYKNFLRSVGDSHPRRGEIKDRIRRCAVGIRQKSSSGNVIVENLGPNVNGEGDDFRPVFSPNYDTRIYFSSAREGVVGGLRDSDGRPDELGGHYCSDMFTSALAGGSWKPASPLSYLLNSPRFDVLQDFSRDGKRLYYFKGFTAFSGDIHVDTFKTRPEDRSLLTKTFVGPMESWKGDCDLFFFKDTIALFASRRPGGFGGLDLYIAFFEDGRWGLPENLGPAINSPYDERAPFLTKDGRTLYFSSNHSQRSLGGYDFFRAVYRDENENWETPENLGIPLNSAEDDLHLRVSRDGLFAVFSSHRREGQGGSDIYRAILREKEIGQEKASVPLVFTEVPAYRRLYGDTPPSPNPAAEVEEFKLDPLFYDKSGLVLTGRNMRTLQTVGKMMKAYPELHISLTSHSDGSDPENVDLFFSINRAEKVADYLMDNGIAAERIHLYAVGDLYPMARPYLNGRPNVSGIRLNRRLDFSFENQEDLPVRILIQRPVVNEAIADEAWENFENIRSGLSYRVQVAATSQMYNSPVLQRYPHRMIEKQAGENLYRYSVGLYKTYLSVSQLKKDLESRGADGVFIIAYIDGERISKSEAQTYLEDYPDLENYVSD